MLGRILLIAGTFVLVALGVMHLVIAHAVAGGTPEYAVRLAAAMTGLFVGGAAAALLLLYLLLGRRAQRQSDEDRRN